MIIFFLMLFLILNIKKKKKKKILTYIIKINIIKRFIIVLTKNIKILNDINKYI